MEIEGDELPDASAGKPSLRAALIGAWQLVSYEELPVDGSPMWQPMSEKPRGIILYTPDGYMSAQVMHPLRRPFGSGDWFEGSLEEYRTRALSYIAYSGRYRVDEIRRTLTHSMYVSLFPNWVGQTQARVVRIDDNQLYLSTPEPIRSGGTWVMSYLHWCRAAID